MATIRTFLDANVLIRAFRGEGIISEKAQGILDDPDREWLASDMLRLELIPKSHHHKQATEAAFYEAYFKQVSTFIETTPEIVQAAEAEAKLAGLSAIDALHITSAKLAHATEFITAEAPTKPLFRVGGIKVGCQNVGIDT